MDIQKKRLWHFILHSFKNRSSKKHSSSKSQTRFIPFLGAALRLFAISLINLQLLSSTPIDVDRPHEPRFSSSTTGQKSLFKDASHWRQDLAYHNGYRKRTWTNENPGQGSFVHLVGLEGCNVLGLLL